MDLRDYLSILQRRWWLLLLLPLLVALFSVLTFRATPPSYSHELRYSVSFPPVDREQSYQDPRLGAVQASEYIVDDLTVMFEGSGVAALTRQYLPPEVSEGEVLEAIHVEKTHRLLNVTLTAPTEGDVEAYAEAVRQMTANDLKPLISGLWDVPDIEITLVDDDGPTRDAPALRDRLEIPLRVALAFVAALALAFALDYLDDSLRSRDEAEQLVGPVLAEIPK